MTLPSQSQALSVDARQPDSLLPAPPTLFGRRLELAALQAAVSRLAAGESSLLLISGPSGSGKSSLLAAALQPAALAGNVHVAVASYESGQQDIPYSALRQALAAVVRQILAADDTAITRWRDKLCASLGPNGQAMVELIPELAWLVGPQPGLVELEPEAHRQRFLFTFRSFVAALAPLEHPLILALDNLHWADEGSLELFSTLADDSQPRALLLVGTARSDMLRRAPQTSPLQRTLASLEANGVDIEHVRLKPLPLAATNELVAAMLRGDPLDTEPLAERIQLHAQGNPFWAIELVRSWVQAGAITPGTPARGCRWDLAAIDELPLRDDVAAEGLASAIDELPAAARRSLQLGALLGSSFDLATLARVQQRTAEAVAADLQPALRAGMLAPVARASGAPPAVRFRHDRIQEAAQAGLSDPERQALHLCIGRVLLASLAGDETLFRALHHLNAAASLVVDPSEQRQLAKLNHDAGRLARHAAAYGAAWSYFRQGLALLAGDEDWSSDYALALALYVEGAEAAYLSAHHAAVEPLARAAAARATSAVDKARACQAWIQSAIAQNELDRAMDLTLGALAELGIHLPERHLRLSRQRRPAVTGSTEPGASSDAPAAAPGDDLRSLMAVAARLASTRWELRGRRVEELADLPPVTDPALRIAGAIMASVGHALQLQGSPHRVALFSLEAMRLSLRHGLFPTSAVGYAAYGAMLCMLDGAPGFGDVDLAYRMGQLAMQLVERPEARPYRARVAVPVQYIINHRRVHHRESLAPLLAGYEAGLESGDPEGALLSGLCYVSHAFQLGLPLDALELQIAAFAATAAQYQQRATELALALNHQAVLNLLGRADDPLQLTGERCDEEAVRAELEQSGSSGTLTAFLIVKARLAYQFHNPSVALALADQVLPRLNEIAGFFAYPRFLALDALIRLDCCDQADRSQRRRLLRQAKADLRRVQRWAQQAPMNHEPQVRFVQAELARVEGRPAAAAAHYAAAIELCQEHGWAGDEPLAAERAARFYLARGELDAAREHLRLARAGYLRWGALGVVQQGDRVYAAWLPELAAAAGPAEPPPAGAGPDTIAGRGLDLGALLRAACGATGEEQVAAQVQRLMAVLTEQAGAQHSALLIPDPWEDPAGETVAGLRVEAECTAGGPCCAMQGGPLLNQALEAAAAPRRVVNFVVHSRQSLALADVAHEPPFDADPAVLARQIRSLLCLPLRQPGRLLGVLYLENLPAADEFTAEQVELLALLASQAALSVQNTRLREGRVGSIQVDKGGEEQGIAAAVGGPEGVARAEGGVVAAGLPQPEDEQWATSGGAGEAARWATARMRQARLHLREGRWAEASAQVDEALAAAQRAGDGAAWRPIALGCGPELAVLPGGRRRCQVMAQQASALAPTDDHDWQLALLAHEATTAWLAGRTGEVLAAYRRSLALTPPETARWTAAASDLLALAASAHTARREYEQARQVLDLLAAHLHQAGLGETRDLCYLFRQARLDWLRGSAGAPGSIAQARQFLEARPEHPWTPALLPAVQGLSALLAGQRAEAERHLRDAASAEAATPSLAVAARPSLLLAHVLHGQGAADAALDVLIPVLESCRRDRTPGLLVQEGAAVIPVLRLAAQQGRCGPMAAHVLGLLGVSNVTRRLLVPETGIVLSPREVDVLELLAADAPNRAIAERLDVDITTVKSHLTRVLAKMGVRTRYEAAERARALGLGNGW